MKVKIRRLKPPTAREKQKRQTAIKGYEDKPQRRLLIDCAWCGGKPEEHECSSCAEDHCPQHDTSHYLKAGCPSCSTGGRR